MADRATLVATLGSAPDSDGRSLAQLAPLADILELRADLVGDLDPAFLRQHFPGRLLYTLRSRSEGGSSDASRERRRRRLLDAAAGFDLVDLEGERDLAEDLLAAWPPERRIVSWHGVAADADELSAKLSRLTEVPAKLYKLVPFAARSGEELAPLQLLGELGRRDVVAFAGGSVGAWTRLLAPRLGAPWLYAAAGEVAGAPGQPTLERLRRDYDLPWLGDLRWLCGVVGAPVGHSLSPRLHNAAYRALGLPGLYLPFEVPDFGAFWLEVVEGELLGSLGLPLRGLSVTTPHKEMALAVAGVASPLAQLAGAANTLVVESGTWAADTTDAMGVVAALEAIGRPPARLRAAVLGAGGAGRVVAAGLAHAGASVTLVNRTVARGSAVARELGATFVPLPDFSPLAFDVIVNATPLGREASDALPIDLRGARAGTVAIDLVYGEAPTPWLERARASGLIAIDGREVLVQQAIPQFRLMTGHELPVALGRSLLGLPEQP